ncbi:MAG: hypothetical protein RO469_05135 [Thermincola sp.]|jgi:hypothetical protein|nr:hypothetical protein [Thermincola sp.]
MHSEEFLISLGANETEVVELMKYTENVYNHSAITGNIDYPMPDEPFVRAWEQYEAEAVKRGAFPTLKDRLMQFKFPIREGISSTEPYRAATRRGVTDGITEEAGLVLEVPEGLELVLHQTPAGRIPLLITRRRADFVTMVQALSRRNEPQAVPDSMGAVIIAGYNNWDRIHTFRREWEKKNPENLTEESWQAEFQRLIPQKELYQDKFIILSDGPYSAVPAESLGLSEEEWRRLSLIIRREHECTHYFTRRLFSAMRNNLLDELIADYMGIVSAVGSFRADWFLRFVGLEHYPQYRTGARLENYRGDPPLSDGAFKILWTLVKLAAERLEAYDSRVAGESRTPEQQVQTLVGLSRLTLIEIASGKAEVLSI